MKRETIPVRCIATDGKLVAMTGGTAGFLYPQSDFDRMDFYPRVGMRFTITLEASELEDIPLDGWTLHLWHLVGVSRVIDCT